MIRKLVLWFVIAAAVVFGGSYVVTGLMSEASLDAVVYPATAGAHPYRTSVVNWRQEGDKLSCQLSNGLVVQCRAVIIPAWNKEFQAGQNGRILVIHKR